EPPRPSPLSPTMDVARWRAEFPILARKTYLNSCSLGALSRRSEARVRQFMDEWHEHGASAWYETWMGRLAELRGRVGGVLGAGTEEVALVASVSAGLASVASALDYDARPRVVVAELDFPTLAYQWMARPGVEVVRVPSDDGVTIDPARFADAVDERTAVLATSHVFFTTGAIQDLPALAEIAHAKGALFLVDAYHGVGQMPVDARASGADVLLCGPLKWLLGGPGLAYLYARRERLAELVPRLAGWFGAADQFSFDIERLAFKEDARRFELGTPALHAVHSALGGQEIIEEVGPAAIRSRNRMLTERLIEGARAVGLPLRVAEGPERRSAIVMVAEADPAGAVARLAERGIVVDWRPGFVRVSPHFYNTEDEVDRVLAELVAWRSR
ncbi:MAG TPA: aminotransferase class V-fold PLP-dependent enzyme, partial [Longimicrobiales bacterium]|nr:aminotransferase class V-fold PLP-dependent enzyme [Longimicrobiales bacterium]